MVIPKLLELAISFLAMALRSACLPHNAFQRSYSCQDHFNPIFISHLVIKVISCSAIETVALTFLFRSAASVKKKPSTG